MAWTQPLANTKQSSAQGTDPGKSLICVFTTLWGSSFKDVCCAALWRWRPSGFTLAPLIEMGKLKPSPPSLSSSPSLLWLLSLLCDASKHFPGTHALDLNVLISPRYTTCKCGYTFTFVRNVFIDLLGFNLFLAYLRKKIFSALFNMDKRLTLNSPMSRVGGSFFNLPYIFQKEHVTCILLYIKMRSRYFSSTLFFRKIELLACLLSLSFPLSSFPASLLFLTYLWKYSVWEKGENQTDQAHILWPACVLMLLLWSSVGVQCDMVKRWWAHRT